MRYLRLALVVLASSLGIARAQDDQQNARPPVEIPDFSNLDDFIYVPKSTVTVGFRLLSGAKTSFSGKGKLVSSADAPGAATGANLVRIYHDGAVNPDSRAVGRVDSDGNPVTDPATGAPLTDPIAPDGRTNSWNYLSSKQQTADGLLAFNSYTADIVDTTARRINGSRNGGMELAVTRDMGKLGGSRATWSLMAGMSVNDISTKTAGSVLANITTLTDLYSLNGAPIPDAPYSAPSTSSISVLDSNGNAALNDDGSSQTVAIDTTTLIGNQPASRATKTGSDTTSVNNQWKLHGGYFTFRAGPTVFVPMTTRLRASVSVGAALVYAGSTYTVTQSFTPDTGTDITDTSSSAVSHLLAGYYADASLQFDITERAGLFAGAVFQSAGSYTQNISTTASNYSTRIDLSNQSGLRAGMTIRF